MAEERDWATSLIDYQLVLLLVSALLNSFPSPYIYSNLFTLFIPDSTGLSEMN